MTVDMFWLDPALTKEPQSSAEVALKSPGVASSVEGVAKDKISPSNPARVCLGAISMGLEDTESEIL